MFGFDLPSVAPAAPPAAALERVMAFPAVPPELGWLVLIGALVLACAALAWATNPTAAPPRRRSAQRTPPRRRHSPQPQSA
jgi:hypothetical protein